MVYTALALGFVHLPGMPGASGWLFAAVQVFAGLLAVQVWLQERTRTAALLAAAMMAPLLSALEYFSGSQQNGASWLSPAFLLLGSLFFVLLDVALGLSWDRLRRAGRWPGRLALTDTLIVSTTAGVVVWILGLDTQVAAAHTQPLLAALLLTYAAAQLLGITLLAMLWLRGARGPAITLGAAGLLCFAAADLALLAGQTSEMLQPLLWVWGSTLLALGIRQLPHLCAQAPRLGGPLPARMQPLLRRLPYVAVAICCALLLEGAVRDVLLPAVQTDPRLQAAHLQHTWSQLGVSVGSVAVVCLVMLRQAETSRANRQMQQQLEASRHELEHLAYHDDLTGLPNRSAFNQFFEDHVGPAEPYAIFSLDLDGFKYINDTYGHATGDRMLHHAARQLNRAVAAPGQIFRWGGDEFVIVVPGLERSTEAEALIRLLTVSLQEPMLHRGQPLRVGTSVGYALGRGNHSHEALLGLADSDMYSTKARSGQHR
ncbi:GGDEF domain-containing protein [Deinococcus sp. Marseille-Q6407]|uniref:GGDEF domain-containing protein n=1 Tax=Deinococcus sp. Marseille-Q6407 TaxID=2969223 RepID=UPI0021BE4AD3|nr:GGDEF domain-containing protein [Deinococcus sp. Marseille-Q6407]